MSLLLLFGGSGGEAPPEPEPSTGGAASKGLPSQMVVEPEVKDEDWITLIL